MSAIPLEQIDLHLLKIAFPTAKSGDLIPWIDPIHRACKEFGIDTVREIASFLGNIAVESCDTTRLEESLNYSCEGLRKTFGRHRISDAQCLALGRTKERKANQEAIANIIYGGEWGRVNLGNTMAGDGWRFRGYGLKQLTGRANVTKCAAALGVRLADMPAYLRTREGAARSAGWYWKSHGLDRVALTPGWTDDRQAVNGGTLGLETMADRANQLVKELIRRGC